MSLFEALRVALTQLWAHKLKSLFSLIGVVIGITFLIAVITVVEGMNRYVQDDFAGSLFGVNTFSVVRRPTVQTGNRSAEEIRRLARNPSVDLDDVEAVRRDLALFKNGEAAKLGTFANMGLNGVLATQIWHHLYLSSGLCDLPNHAPDPQVERPTQPLAAA